MSLQTDVAALRVALNEMERALRLIEEHAKTESGIANGYTRPHMAAIFRVVCQHYKVPETCMRSRVRTASFALPRQMAMFLARELTAYSAHDIAACFRADMDTGTIFHGCKRISDQLCYDEDLRAVIAKLTAEIGPLLTDKTTPHTKEA